MRKFTFVNGSSTITLGPGSVFVIESVEGLSEAKLQKQEQKAPYQDGTTYIDTLFDVRDIIIKGSINYPKNLTQINAQKDVMYRALNPKNGEGWLTYEYDGGSKKIKAVASVIFKNKPWKDPFQEFQVTFRCCDPLWQDVNSKTINLPVNNLMLSTQLPAAIENCKFLLLPDDTFFILSWKINTGTNVELTSNYSSDLINIINNGLITLDVAYQSGTTCFNCAYDNDGNIYAYFLNQAKTAYYYVISQDKGLNWSSPVKIADKISGDGSIHAADENYNNQMAIVTASNGAFYTSNRWQTKTNVASNAGQLASIDATGINSLRPIYYKNDAWASLGADHSIHRTTDFVTYNTYAPGLPANILILGDRGTNQHNDLLAYYKVTGTPDTYYISQSSDGGETWAVGSQVFGTEPSSIVSSGQLTITAKSDYTDWYILGGPTYFVGNDYTIWSANSVRNLYNGFECYWMDYMIDANGPGWFHAAGMIYKGSSLLDIIYAKSEDGITWGNITVVASNISGTVSQISISDKGDGLIIVYQSAGGVYQRVETGYSGSSWGVQQTITASAAFPPYIIRKKDGTLMVCYGGKYKLSTDNGANWGSEQTFSPAITQAGCITQSDNGTLIVSSTPGNGGGSITYLRSTDNGATWSAGSTLSAGTNILYSISAISGNRFVATYARQVSGNDPIYQRYSNDGITWESELTLIADPKFDETTTGYIKRVKVIQRQNGDLFYLTKYIFKKNAYSVNANITGHIGCPVLITFNGPATNPRIINETTGEYFSINKTLISGESFTINTAFGQKTVDMYTGGIHTNGMAYMNLDSTFIQLVPGFNKVYLEDTPGTATQSATMTWAERYIGT